MYNISTCPQKKGNKIKIQKKLINSKVWRKNFVPTTKDISKNKNNNNHLDPE